MAAGHTLIAHDSLLKAISKIDVNSRAAEAELDLNWAVLSEAVQTVMRKHNIGNAYERIKEVTRGREFDKAAYFDLVAKISSEIGPEDTERLLALSPASYLGYAPFLASRACL